MAVLKTQKIHICALKSSRKKILEELQRAGAVQIIEDETPEDEIFRKMDTGASKNRFAKRVQNAEEALAILKKCAPEKKGIFSSLEGKGRISREEYYEKVEERLPTLDVISRILALKKQMTEDQAAQARVAASLEALTPWMTLDVPLNYKGTKRTAAFIGTLPGHVQAEQIGETIARSHPEIEAYDLEVLGADKDQTCIFAVCPKGQAAAFEEALRSGGFVRTSLQSGLTTQEYAAELKADGEKYAASEKAALEEIVSLAGERENIRFAADYYRMRAEKYNVLGGLLQSDHVFFINGYVPETAAPDLKAKLEKEYTCDVTIDEPDPDDEAAPVILKNNKFSAPTESVVESYGLPGKKDIDPTTIMSFCYYFMFGLMLSDAGYGLIMVIGCALAVKKFPNMGDGLKRMLKMFFWCGVSTTFWGIMFGGFFGDVVDVVAATFFGLEVSLPALWLVPLEEPMVLLIYCFLFGIIHLYIGLGISGYQMLKEKQYMSFFANVICWYVFLTSLILMLIPSSIFASMLGTTIVFPRVVNKTVQYLAIISAVCIVLFSENRKNPIMRIALGAYDLYGVSSWLSDVLSYSRLMALGLATGVIATVVNTMGSMAGGGILGAIVFILVFIVGHTLNMAINLLGAYVHTNRLQFVEFFGKFYEGGGRPFKPFSAAKNKYFLFKEEN